MKNTFSGCVCIVLAVVAGCFWTRTASAYTPESPQVQAMVNKAVNYLKKASASSASHQLGEVALQGLALVKAGVPKDDPAVERCAKQALSIARGKKQNAQAHYQSYNMSVLLLFLLELDRERYRQDIEQFKKLLLERQQPAGAVSYYQDNQGDTSQTQYAALAFWTLDHYGFSVPVDRVVRMLQWFLTAQNPDGSWGYKIQIAPGELMKGRKGGGNITQSLAVGGTGSSYILADLLRLPSARVEQKQKGVLIPPPLKVPPRKEDPDGPRANFPANILQAAQRDGIRYIHNKFKILPNESHKLYFMYGYERFAAFRAKAEGRDEKEPQWYNMGVEALAKEQQGDGSWKLDSAGALPGTCFAVMFLTRSTRKSVGEVSFSEGELRGGRGLPGDTSRVVLRNGRVEAVPVAKSFGELMKILDDPSGDELAMIASLPDATEVKGDKEAYERHASRLRRLAEHEKYEVRVVAVRALAKARDIDNVPVLIYALSDPDWNVVKEARDGLRFVSRKFDGFGIKAGMNEKEMGPLIEKWRLWFLSVRPDADLR